MPRRLVMAICLVLGLWAPLTTPLAALEDPGDVVGQWCLVQWAEPEFPGKVYVGHLRVDPADADGLFTGEMLIRDENGLSFARQSMVYEVSDGALIGYGRIVEAQFWAADTIRLVLHDGHLVGGGVDTNRETFRAEFRPGSCEGLSS